METHYGQGDLVEVGDRVCTVTNPFKQTADVVNAPFTGVVVGVVKNPLVYPGNPLCHVAEVDDAVRRAIERQRAGDGGAERV